MNRELLAFARYAWTKNLAFTVILVATVVASQILGTAGLLLINNEPWRQAFAGINFVLILFGLLYSIVLFEFGKSSSLAGIDGSYDRWLLRLPLATWKLALIPAFLITCWVAVFWSLFAVAIWLHGGPSLPLVTQTLAVSAVAICVSSISWTPQRHPWQRLGIFFISLPVFVGLSVMNVEIAKGASWLAPVGGITAVLSYVGANLLAFRSIRLARVSTFQQWNDSEPNLIDRVSVGAAHCFDSSHKSPDQFDSPQSALRWYDVTGTWLVRWRLLAMVLVIVAFTIVSLRASGATSIAGLFFALICSVTFACNLIEPAVWSQQSSLPSYLIVSPLSSRTIAWTRLATTAKIVSNVFVLIASIFMIDLICDASGGTAFRSLLDVHRIAFPGAPVQTMFACYVGLWFVSISLAVNLICVQLHGRQQLGITVFLLGTLIVGIPSSIVLRWFVTQDNWEIVSATSSSWLAWIPNLIYVLTALKLALSSLAIVASYRHQLVTKEWIVQIVIAWLLVAVLGAILFWLIWPGDNLPFDLVLFGSILFLPLGAIFEAPIAVDTNRHRSAG